MKKILFTLLVTFIAIATVQADEQIPIIFDTDFVMPPHDDSMALMLALQSPEFENSTGLPCGEIFDQFISRRGIDLLAGFEACDLRLYARFQLGPRRHRSSRTSRSDATKPESWASVTVTGGASWRTSAFAPAGSTR